ncbi:hypothetical protein P7C70_g6208, partial [Phenoliferia sp. Uapishka_3]
MEALSSLGSRECQVGHYKDHKWICSSRKSSQRALEEKTLASPTLIPVWKDIADFMKLIREEVVYAIRTLLKIGTPDSLHLTHVMVLRFDYNESASPDDDVASRFTLKEGFDISTVSMLESARGKPMEECWLKVTQVQNKNPAAVGEIFVGIFFDFRWRMDPTRRPDEWDGHQSSIHPIWVNPRIWGSTIPVQDRRPVPDWKVYLRKVLAGPLPREESVRKSDELRASEKESTIKAAVRRTLNQKW